MESTSSPSSQSAEWFYIGHYGQLGPLTQDQLEELVVDGVVSPETYVWRPGMADWVRAAAMPELMPALRTTFQASPPTPPPGPGLARPAAPPVQLAPHRPPPPAIGGDAYAMALAMPVSDKNRYVAGVLQFIPGVGRLYLGYAAQGVLQILLTPLCLLGWVWSIIDGIVMLSGGVKYDGYGRKLPD